MADIVQKMQDANKSRFVCKQADLRKVDGKEKNQNLPHNK